jgi:ATP-dependent DNA helicase RecG
MKTGFNKSKTIRILNSLIDKNVISKIGSGTTQTYKLK